VVTSPTAFFLSKHWRNTVYSNVWIALCAAAWMLEAEWSFGDSSNGILPLFAFFSTVFLYNFQRAIKLFRSASYAIPGRNAWLVKNRKAIALWAGIGGIASVVVLLLMPLRDWIVIAMAGAVSVAYVTKLGRIKGKWVAVREFPYVKIYLIAIVWVVLGVILPIVHFQIEIADQSTVFLLMLEKFCFIIAITIPFDIRDLKYDEAHMKTLPQILGVKTSRFVALAFGLAAVGLTGMLIGDFYSMSSGIAMMLVLCVSAFAAFQAHENRDELYFTGLLDGLFILRALALGIALLS
jgi:hypothetical protein